MNYNWLTDREHMITIRNRDTGFARQVRYWNQKIINKVLNEQKSSEDVFVNKYPTGRLVDTVVLDFDNKDDPSIAYAEVNRLRNFLKSKGINSVIVESGSKGNHIYIQICPVLFKDTMLRQMSDWNSYFNAFVCFLIHDSSHVYETLDKVNFTASLNGNIRLIGSKHPSTGKKCQIIKGSFKDSYVVTKWQDEAMKKAYLKMEISAQEKQKQLKRTKAIDGDDPCKVNDLRDIFREITGDMKLYPKGYGYCSCPVHGIDAHPSLLVTKEWFSCSACDFKGNIWTLRKMGLVEFNDKGEAKFK
jgi:hypothetical protein